MVGAAVGGAGDSFGGGEEAVDGQGVVQVPDVGRVQDRRFDVDLSRVVRKRPPSWGWPPRRG